MSQDTISLTLEKRDVIGKAVKHLRREGLVPGVIHDHGKESLIVMADYQTMFKAYKQAGKHHPVQVKAGGKTYTALIKSVTFDPKYNALTHIVFGAVTADEKVDAEVPVHATFDEDNDASPAERAGLIVLEQLTSVEIEALPGDLPDELTFNGEKLVQVGDQITVADLIVPKGVVIKTEETHVLATVFEPSALAAANDAAGGDADEDTDVVAEHGDASSDVDSQAPEDQPGGKKQFEPKGE